MNQNLIKSDKEKVTVQIKKLLALSKSPFKAEADAALKKAKILIEQYDLKKVKIQHPEYEEYELLLYRALCDSFGGIWHEKYVYGSEKLINLCLKRSKKCIEEIKYGMSECKKTLTQNAKNSIGVDFWYNKGFYFGLCEGLNVKPQYLNLKGISSLDYGSQIYTYNNAYSHGLGIGRYYRVKNRDN